MRSVLLPLVALAAVEVSAVDIIAHRGFSGAYPESTNAANQAAVKEGADWLECDVVPSKDGVVYCSHEPHLAELNSDITRFKHRAKFPLDGIRKATVERAPDGNYYNTVEGWFFSDYNSVDIDELKVAQRYMERDQTNSEAEPFLKLKDFIKYARSAKVGLYIEPKHSDWFYDVAGIELNMLIVKDLVEGFGGEIVDASTDEIPEIDLEALNRPDHEVSMWRETLDSAKKKAQGKKVVFPKNAFDIPVVIESFLYEDLAFYKYIGWADQQPTCALTWDARALPTSIWGETYLKGEKFVDSNENNDQDWQDDSGPSLKSVAVDAASMKAVNAQYLGPDKSLLLTHEDLVSTAHKNKIKVHIWTLRNDNANHVARGPWPPAGDAATAAENEKLPKTIVARDANIPKQFQSCVTRELDFFVEAGVDGIFTDNVNTLNLYLKRQRANNSGISPSFIGGIITSVLSLLAILAF